MANVFADLKATKNPSTRLILLDDSVELSTLAIVVSRKIRLRCFRATDNRWKYYQNKGKIYTKSFREETNSFGRTWYVASTSQVNGNNFDVNVATRQQKCNKQLSRFLKQRETLVDASQTADTSEVLQYINNGRL